MHVCTNLHMYVSMCMYQSTRTHIHHTQKIEKYIKYHITNTCIETAKTFPQHNITTAVERQANLLYCSYSVTAANLLKLCSKHHRISCIYVLECIHINCTHLDRSVDTDSGVEMGSFSSSSPTVVATTSGLLTTLKQE